MTQIIEQTTKLKFHTDLKELVKPFRDEFLSCNWLLTNQEYILLDYENKGVVDKLDHGVSIEFTGKELLEIIDTRSIQFVWGVFCGVKGSIPQLQKENLPFADCNSKVWTHPEQFLLSESEIEIICFDGTSTIVKFRNKNTEIKFKAYFDEAKTLKNNRWFLSLFSWIWRSTNLILMSSLITT
jgi:hypothetical protein